MRKSKGSIFIGLGFLFLFAALALCAYNLWEEQNAQTAASQTLPLVQEQQSVAEAEQSQDEDPQIPNYLLHPEIEMPCQTIDGEDYIGTLCIPSLGLELPIISQWSYDRLKIAPCRYQGSAYCGDLILAAHNYPAHFGRLNELHAGDSVSFTDMDGNSFFYQVVELEILSGTATEEMESGDWDLTLFTCTFSGQDRITLRCEEINA